MQQKPFDPGEPFDAMAENFRIQMANMALTASEAAIYRDLDGIRQIECFVAGVLTGLVGVCFSQIEPTKIGRDQIMRVIEHYLPHAREQVEIMLDAKH